jgi:acetyl-CoA synthetase
MAGNRDERDIDSMDVSNFLMGLVKRFHVDIPERDCGELKSIDPCVEYLLSRQSSQT